MTTNLLTYLYVSKKHLFVVLVTVAISSLPIRAQIKYIPLDEHRDAGMGLERVARFSTAAYKSKLAQKDGEIRWVQVDYYIN